MAVLVIPAIVRAGHTCQSGCKPAVISDCGPATGGPVTIAAAEGIIAPPPGTIGDTYTRVSHPIPEDEHPRTAMLAVRDHRTAKYLRVQRMGGFRMQNDIWLFESSQPLFPGQDHVVRVEARQDSADIQPYKVKFVRLIPGRIVYLDF
jgi:hypothetical protein